MNFSETIAITSLAIALISVLWNVFFGYGKVIGKIDSMQTDVTGLKSGLVNLEEKMERRFEKVENKIEHLRIDVHKLDVRLTAVEQELKMR